MATETFRDAGDCPVESIEIQKETNEPAVQRHVGKLWVGAEWIDVAQARALREWLDEVIP